MSWNKGKIVEGEGERDSAAPSRDGTDTGRLNNSSLTGESILVAITKL